MPALALLAVMVATSLACLGVVLLVPARLAWAAEDGITIYARKAWTTTAGVEVTAPKGTMPIELELLRYVGDDPSAAEPAGKTLEVDETTGWQGSIDGLEAADAEGRPYHYTFREVDPPVPYEVRSITGSGLSEDDPIVVTNAPATASLSITKAWKDDSDAHDLRPDDVEFVLANDKGLDVQGYAPAWTKEGDSWTATYAGLPKYAEDGSVVSWSVTEKAIDGYKTSYSSGDHAEDGGTITNELLTTPEPDPDPDPTPEPGKPQDPEPAPEPDPEPTPEKAETPEAETLQPSKQAAATTEKLPQTGDEGGTALLAILAACGLCLAGLGVAARLRHRQQ